ncbi:MAG: hypothetical protein PHN51_07275 [Candidatus Nanopelagicales bacterium]|nr:hypothetical protein [Candidatus Nanopelagicales bacterium]
MTKHLLGKERFVLIGALIVASAFVTSCGVPVETLARPIPDGAITPHPTFQSSSPKPAKQSLWFVKDDGLVKVQTDFQGPVSPDALLNILVAGPAPGSGLRTVAADPISGAAMLSYAPPAATTEKNGTPLSDVIVIKASPAFSVLPPTEQILLLGQVVLTLTSAGWQAVAITDEAGSAVAVPLPNGRLLDRPAVAGDYLSLERK